MRIALSKGRIFDATLPLFEKVGLVPSENPERSRKLIIPARQGEVDFLVVRASDVPTYVQHGGADLGVVGKDVLLEHGGAGLLEPLDLDIARCRLMVAGFPGTDLDSGHRFRVATKFTECARRHFAATGRQVDIIKLYGSMELAPLVGLADLIVDVVDTGSTLTANGLAPLELINEVSSRLIVNRAAMKVRHAPIDELLARLDTAVAGRAPGAA
ncbi:MAG: ATP phosphoribosyltransferase [Gammaproteobacteria bacterium]|nr:MAG: ATP phosphoribosyltransferase [Gammaproteobacteria bacterium]